jgi:mitochondrial import receptor subunit TOM22
MVKLEEITDVDKQPTGPYSPGASEASASTASVNSVSSTGSDTVEKETFIDRLTALVDIIPPKTRHSISQSISKGTSALKTGGKLVGNAVWIVTTSALLVALPLALVLEDEAKIVQQERDIMAQQQGQQVRCLSFSTPKFLAGKPYCFRVRKGLTLASRLVDARSRDSIRCAAATEPACACAAWILDYALCRVIWL